MIMAHEQRMRAVKSALDSPQLHEKFRGGMSRYFNGGIVPGSFLTAVLKNDLRAALMYADDESIEMLPSLVRWLFFDLRQPDMWGSDGKVKRHVFLCNRAEDVDVPKCFEPCKHCEVSE